MPHILLLIGKVQCIYHAKKTMCSQVAQAPLMSSLVLPQCSHCGVVVCSWWVCGATIKTTQSKDTQRQNHTTQKNGTEGPPFCREIDTSCKNGPAPLIYQQSLLPSCVRVGPPSWTYLQLACWWVIARFQDYVVVRLPQRAWGGQEDYKKGLPWHDDTSR